MGYFFCALFAFLFGMMVKSVDKKKYLDEISVLKRQISNLNEELKSLNKKSKPLEKKYFQDSQYKNDYSGAVEYYTNEKFIDKDFLFPKKVESSHLLNKKKIVFSGDFNNISRNDMAKMAWDVGADVDTAVGNKTAYLIIGSNFGESKYAKIVELKEQGQEVDVLSELDYLKLFA